ncbi:hypothetical protein KY290_027119 [Solanum tuberosum]|uniref:Uncharacterized protein n=1 Tax=Solanum tuberosum TaxID=4113 RepID=A0ABQ7UE64_SOLTU|nr:hypothetical protein KY284_026081 [Solanum tuberosum]KAH0747887.1 hypothetical protein KY290_027119 [Solanum tuberosum]
MAIKMLLWLSGWLIEENRFITVTPVTEVLKAKQLMIALDAGFGAIVQHYKEFQQLSLSDLLADRVFEYIRVHAKMLEMLSLGFLGDNHLGMLSGCESLCKLEIRDCPFGDEVLLSNGAKLETM